MMGAAFHVVVVLNADAEARRRTAMSCLNMVVETRESRETGLRVAVTTRTRILSWVAVEDGAEGGENSRVRPHHSPAFKLNQPARARSKNIVE